MLFIPTINIFNYSFLIRKFAINSNGKIGYMKYIGKHTLNNLILSIAYKWLKYYSKNT